MIMIMNLQGLKYEFYIASPSQLKIIVCNSNHIALWASWLC